MAELFLNPWSMALGALFVSVPVIIHLINRMRFRRVRWAAMEFLLKAQKRMRRKLIFQQLLLLFLRMLLVFLFGLLLGRFLGFDPLNSNQSQSTSHIVVLDDSPSMSDSWRGEDGQKTDSMTAALKILTEQIAPSAAQATTPQTLDLIRLSELSTPRGF
ncbi:MAG: BatA domain-containing protein, partial [Gemmataceae bacterium]